MAAAMLERMLPNLRDRLDDLRSTYWFVPTLMLGGGALLATIMVAIDGRDWLPPPGEDSIYHAGDPESARTLLSTLAGSMITVAGLVFSMTTVSLTVASSQYGPHLLRNFMRDRGHQLVIGTFTATFLYCLLVQRVIPGGSEAADVPHWSITLALGLAVVDLVVLVYFIHHVAASIRISNVVSVVSEELDETVSSLYPDEIEKPGEEEATLALPEGIEGAPARTVRARRTGYLRSIDFEALLRLTEEHDLFVILRRHPGEFLLEGSALLSVQPAPRVDERLEEQLRGVVAIGAKRTAFQDVLFSFDQLVGVALRALSPGINDPQTAVACIHRLGEGVAKIARRKIPSGRHAGEGGVLRIAAETTDFAEVLSAAFDRIRAHGAEHQSVIEALQETLDAISARTTQRSRRALIDRCREAVRQTAENAYRKNPDLVPMFRAVSEPPEKEASEAAEEAG